MAPRAHLQGLAIWGDLLLAAAAGGWLMLRMPGRSFSGPLPALTEEEREVRARLERHVRVLAGEIGERNLWRARALQAAAGYVERVLRDLGVPVAWQEFRVREIAARNLEVELRGQRAPEEIVLAGAHYDSVYGSPGANDNATGTAAVLELARLLKPLVHCAKNSTPGRACCEIP